MRQFKKVEVVAGLALSAGLLMGAATSRVALSHDSGHGKEDDSKRAQETKVVIDGGFKPAKIKAKVGREVHLTFFRKEKSGCGNVVKFPGLKETKDGKEVTVERTLKSGEETTITFTPKEKGTLHFTCGMGMYKGSVVVK